MSTITETRQLYRLGETTIQAVLYTSMLPGAFYFNMHDDENTAVDAALAVLPEVGGEILELQHTGSRLISFRLEGLRYVFDPNRIYTEGGLAQTLHYHSHYTEAAAEVVHDFSCQLVHTHNFDSRPLIITLHNTAGTEYSVQSYAPGGVLADTAIAMYANVKRSPWDFFYVTEPEHFEYLRTRDYNVVLNDPAMRVDDGSLSVYCARKSIPYINVEARHDHLDEQIQMLYTVYEMTSEMQC